MPSRPALDAHAPQASYSFTAPLWQWSAQESATWVFVTLPEDVSHEIKDVPRPHRRGFGSIRVTVEIGDSEWATSIFPDSESGCYVLPVKTAIRASEGLEIGDTVNVSVTTLD